MADAAGHAPLFGASLSRRRLVFDCLFFFSIMVHWQVAFAYVALLAKSLEIA
jgi:hypothetical protein